MLIVNIIVYYFIVVLSCVFKRTRMSYPISFFEIKYVKTKNGFAKKITQRKQQIYNLTNKMRSYFNGPLKNDRTVACCSSLYEERGKVIVCNGPINLTEKHSSKNIPA